MKQNLDSRPVRRQRQQSMSKSSSMTQLANMTSGMFKSASGSLLQRSPSGNLLHRSPSGNLLSSFHAQDKWEEQGGWETKSQEVKQLHRMERDDSMVNLLNVFDPKSLADGRERTSSTGEVVEKEQHSALSTRGVVYVGGASAFAWYGLRLVLRDVIKVPTNIMELHALSTIHALGWAVFLAKKVGVADIEVPKYCARALVASLGYYLHDCWALRGTLLANPSMLIHQASMAVTVSSILRSKGVAWLAVPIMSQAVPSLLQELLSLCGSIGLPAVRPEVRGLRLLWFLSFVASKLAIVPTWFRHNTLAEMHQPNLFSGKLSYLACFALDLIFMRSAVKNLSGFLRPAGAMVTAAQAYQKPLEGAQAVGSALVSAAVLGTLFGSYLTGPVGIILALFGLRARSSRRLRLAAGAICGVCAIDQIIPQPKQFPDHGTRTRRFLMPLLRQVLKVFNYRIYPKGIDFLRELPKDRGHLIASTPHGFFPWGAGAVIVSCAEAGYLPNFIGASVLGMLPVAGRLLRMMGFRPATKKELLKCLKQEYPRNVTILLPGGIREMFQIREDIEISASNLHSGFAEAAKESGAMLIPSYAFGVSQLYKVARGPLADFFLELSRRLKTSLAPFTGRWGTLLPYPYEMACAMGEPIDTRKCKDGKEVHRLFLEGLRSAFEEHKGAFGWGDRELYFEGEDMPDPPSDILDEYTALPTSNRSRL